jgi:hypothetical protein
MANPPLLIILIEFDDDDFFYLKLKHLSSLHLLVEACELLPYTNTMEEPLVRFIFTYS